MKKVVKISLALIIMLSLSLGTVFAGDLWAYEDEKNKIALDTPWDWTGQVTAINEERKVMTFQSPNEEITLFLLDRFEDINTTSELFPMDQMNDETALALVLPTLEAMGMMVESSELITLSSGHKALAFWVDPSVAGTAYGVIIVRENDWVIAFVAAQNDEIFETNKENIIVYAQSLRILK